MAIEHFSIDAIKDEFKVDLRGRGTSSIRGAARIVSVDESTIRGHLESAGMKPSKLAQNLMQAGFEGAGMISWLRDGIPDTALAVIIEYYSFHSVRNCTLAAKSVFISFAAIGIRAWMQQITGWQNPSTRRLTDGEVAELCLLPFPTAHQKRFDAPYYEQMSKLTGLPLNGSKRPKRWGQLTDEWVYKMLPIGVREGCRKCREANGGWDKLHQFLSSDGLEIFTKHYDTLLLIMRSQDSVNGVRRALRNLTATDYQRNLFDDCRKDGTLTVSRQLKLLDSDALA